MAFRIWSASTAYLLLFHALLYVKCAVPEDLSNFQNEHVCDTRVRLVRPKTVADVQKAVKRHRCVVPIGGGCSWNKEFFCAKPAPKRRKTAVNIVMTTIRPLKIVVDEENMSAWVSAGVTIWDLMTYLGNYVTETSPRGFALGSVPTFVNQTIAGAVATNTHGSSLQHGSMSNQVVGFRVVLANGTLTEIYPDNHPLYFKAFQVNVGRLGIVTDVKMRIIRETLVHRRLQIPIQLDEFLPRLREAQEMYKSSGTVPHWLSDDGQFMWFPTDSTFAAWFLERPSEEESQETISCQTIDWEESYSNLLEIKRRINQPIHLPRSEMFGDVSGGLKWTIPESLPSNPAFSNPENAAMLIEFVLEQIRSSLGNKTGDTHEVAIVLPPPDETLGDPPLNDDYEVAIPVNKVADCLEGFFDFVQRVVPDNGLRYPSMLRYVGQEEGLLSVARDTPILWFGLTDYVYYNQEPRRINEPFKKLLEYFTSSELCSPVKLHWGKAGWPESGCWNGAEQFKNTWCDFGCAVRALDPEDKFVGSAPDRWNWKGANLKRCCTAEGYDTTLKGCDCNVVPLRSAEECQDAVLHSVKTTDHGSVSYSTVEV